MDVPNASLTDQELMQLYQKGDASAFEQLYTRYSGRVYGYLRSRLGDSPGGVRDTHDVFQAVFLKLHQSRAQFDPKYPFAPWLFTVCRTVLVDHLRRKDPLLSETQELEPDLLRTEESAESEPQERFAGALAGVAQLPSQQRQALELRYGAELSFEEIAERLATSPANVRQLVSRALRKLRNWGGV